MIERAGQLLLGLHLVEGFDAGVDPVVDRLREISYVGATVGAFILILSNAGDVDGWHAIPPYQSLIQERELRKREGSGGRLPAANSSLHCRVDSVRRSRA